MKKVIGIVLALSLLIGVIACTPSLQLWEHLTVLAADGESAIEVEGNIMAVFYRLDTEQVLFWLTDGTITDTGDGKWDIDSAQIIAGGVNQAIIDYGLYKYQDMPPLDVEPIYLDDLNLQPITADDLPHSQHIGKLVSVDAAKARPATITRKYLGIAYNVSCLVSQSVVDMWVADDLNVGDYVIVSFIDEIPDTTEINLAIVVDKVYESWGS